MEEISVGTFMYRFYEMDIERLSSKYVESCYQWLIQSPAYQKHVMIRFGANHEEWLEMEKINTGIHW